MRKGIALALLAAALYAVNAPFSKLLLSSVPPTLMAGFLYVGAGVGMAAIALTRRLRGKQGREMRLTRRELPWTIAMIALDIAAPICLMLGLRATTAANAALLNNFEIVATALIALLVFGEAVSPRLWAGILFTVVSCAILSFEDVSSLRFSYGSLLILLACVCWGFENNCTRRLSGKDPMQIVLLKGVFSGLGSVIIGLARGERMPSALAVLPVLAVGFVAYGHLLLCVCAAAAGRGAHQRVLRGIALYWGAAVAADLPGAPGRGLSAGAGPDGRGHVAVLLGRAALDQENQKNELKENCHAQRRAV